VLASIFLKRGDRSILEGLRKPLIESSDPKHVLFSVNFLSSESNNDENHRTVKKMLRLFPERHDLRLYRQMLLRELCEFDTLRDNFKPIAAELKKGNDKVLELDPPLANLAWCGDERINASAQHATPAPTGAEKRKRRGMPHRWREDKIRVGYLSSDLWDMHATMKLMGDVLARHDRERFEIHLFCHTAEDKLALNRFDRSNWGDVVRISHLSDAQAAEAVRAREIDVLVDLKGYTNASRCRMLNLPLAPVHVAWLGFPGTTVNIDLDYVIGDHVVLPESSKPFYYEKFCRMPDTYQPNDPVNRPRPQEVPRSAMELPQDAFVFGSFNATPKVSAKMIELWSRILKGAENSVFWFIAPSGQIRTNVAKEFAANGIGRHRIVFAPRIEYQLHINRLRNADLALDTYPYNGHTTTSEALWAGLPVLTYKGTNFASRVAESLLTAVGLPELVVADEEAYVETAIHLYENPHKVAEYKKRLDENRFIKPLFDAERFCRHLETAYEMMVERAKAGLEPDHLDVPALPPRQEAFGAP
jgi:predicted O-linked N-acetylglucosamine transferase (SPINDLY family)